MHIRGGGGEDSNPNSRGEDDDPNLQDLFDLSEKGGSPHTNAAEVTFEVEGSPTKDSQMMGADVPPFAQRNADSPEKQPSQGEQPSDLDSAAAAGGLRLGQAATSSNHTPAASGQQRPVITPARPSSILRRTDANVTVNLKVRFEGTGEVAD